VDTEQSVALVNQQQFYVSISRARLDAQVFTNKQGEMAQAVSRAWPKSTALDAITPSNGSPRFSQRGDRGTHRRVPARREGQGENQAQQTPPRAQVSHNCSERPLVSVHRRQPTDAAQVVSYPQTDWRRERQPPVHEQTITRVPAEQRSQRPVASREETPKHQPERSRGMRYRM